MKNETKTKLLGIACLILVFGIFIGLGWAAGCWFVVLLAMALSLALAITLTPVVMTLGYLVYLAFCAWSKREWQLASSNQSPD